MIYDRRGQFIVHGRDAHVTTKDGAEESMRELQHVTGPHAFFNRFNKSDAWGYVIDVNKNPIRMKVSA
jgi:hypothetical protein